MKAPTTTTPTPETVLDQVRRDNPPVRPTEDDWQRVSERWATYTERSERDDEL